LKRKISVEILLKIHCCAEDLLEQSYAEEREQLGAQQLAQQQLLYRYSYPGERE
jgi:hypothetical protein